jgi:hypothetical protein
MIKPNIDEFNRLINKIEETGVSQVQGIIEKWRRSVVYEIANSGNLDALSTEVLLNKLKFLNQSAQRELTGKLTENQRRLFIKGLQSVDKYLESGKLSVGLPYLSEHKLEQLQRYSADLVTGIIAEAQKNIGVQVSLGVMGQKSKDEIIQSIGSNLEDPSVFGTIAKRAQVVFQTEVKRTQNIATNDRIKQAATQIKDLKKRWIHTHIGIPRPYHLLMHGTTINVNELFTLKGADGNIYEIEAPHDPILPAGEVVNCFIGKTMTDARNIKKIFRQKYSGQLLTINTAAGNEISVTPNHPILTEKGFVKASILNEGMNILRCPFGQKMIMGNPDVNNAPVKLEEIYNSVARKRKGERVASTNMDFYGDISSDGKIDIINIDGLLRNGYYSNISQIIGKKNLTSPNFIQTFFSNKCPLTYFFVRTFRATHRIMIRLHLMFSLSWRHLFPFKNFRFASISIIDVLRFEESSQTDSRKFVFVRKIFDRLTGKILGNNIVRNRNFLSSGFDAPKFQVPDESFIIDLKFKTDILDRLTSNVFSDKITSIVLHNVDSIYVYTLETLESIYKANTIIASNCRCFVTPYVERFKNENERENIMNPISFKDQSLY